MKPQRFGGTSFGFGSSLTRLAKRLLILYTIIYVVELVCEHWLKIPVVAQLQLYPIQSDSFRIWQLVTHPFVHDPRSPLGFLINGLILYFFSAPVEHAFGTRRFLVLFYFSAFGAALSGLAFGSVSGFSNPFMGMLPSLLALIVVFGLLNPNATILLMFILPIKAKYLSYGTVLITLLTFLAKANPSGAYHLGGILFGYLFFINPRLRNRMDLKLMHLKYQQWQLKRKKARFGVIDGGKNKDEDKPTLH